MTDIPNVQPDTRAETLLAAPDREVDAREVFGVDRLRDVEADDFGAYGGGEGAYFEVLGGGFWHAAGKDGSHVWQCRGRGVIPKRTLR